jgi:predicted RNA binding protein YcfA (HicA-like mRNA interferase family)
VPPSTFSGAQVERVLAKADFSFVSQRGSHRKLRSSDGRTVIVPMHDTIAHGTLASILRQAGMTRAQFMCLAE